MSQGIEKQQAPELRVEHWIDEQGKPSGLVKLGDLGPSYKILYCFQAACPGCHSVGFPTLKKLVDALGPIGFGFAAIQTAFEAQEENTRDKLTEIQQKYGLEIPFGHDQLEAAYPTVMQDYNTGGTPWFIVINQSGTVVYNDFGINPDALIEAINSRLKKSLQEESDPN